MRPQRRITLNYSQEQYVRENLGKQLKKDLAKNAGVTLAVLRNNLKVMGLSQTNGVKPEGEFFDVNEYAKNFIY